MHANPLTDPMLTPFSLININCLVIKSGVTEMHSSYHPEKSELNSWVMLPCITQKLQTITQSLDSHITLAHQS